MSEIISNTAWKGINQLVTNLLHSNNLAKDFFKTSEVFITNNTSTNIIVGTDEQQFRERLYGVIPNIKSVIENKSGDIYSVVVSEEKFEDFEVIPAEYKTIEEEEEKLKISYAILDFIEFVYNRIYDVGKQYVTFDATPTELGYTEDVQKIYELTFSDKNITKNKFREDINEIFYRNDLAYELTEKGEIQRILEYAIDLNATSDEPELKKLLETANKKIKSKELSERKIALKELWDAFERIKTLKLTDAQITATKEPQKLKSSSIKELLKSITSNENDDLYTIIEKECTVLTTIGNNYGIRHSEKYQKITDSKTIDYLFFRMYSIIVLLLKGL
ncbi:MAG: hypothetical protein IJ150_11060 [Bacteroidales bacterium]|nr:hypothetical protein [Bacteroidales bacterium]